MRNALIVIGCAALFALSGRTSVSSVLKKHPPLSSLAGSNRLGTITAATKRTPLLIAAGDSASPPAGRRRSTHLAVSARHATFIRRDSLFVRPNATASPDLRFAHSTSEGPIFTSIYTVGHTGPFSVTLNGRQPVKPSGFSFANVGWDPPPTMQQGENTRVNVALIVPETSMTPDEIQNTLWAALTQSRTPKFAVAAVGSSAIANLVADDPDAFTIREEDPLARQQPVIPGKVNTWAWNVIPLKSGHQVLRLFVYSPIGSVDKFREAPPPREIDVAVSIVYATTAVWREYHAAIIPVGISAVSSLALLIWRRFRANHEKPRRAAF